MSLHRNACVVLLAAVLLIPSGVAANEEAILDVQAWFVGYGDLWWEPTPEALAKIKTHYQLPYYLLLETGPTLMDSTALDRFLGSVERAENWRGSRILRMTVSLLNSSSGRIEAEWQDFNDAGEAARPCFAYEYAVGKFGSDWKIVAATQRPCPIEEQE